MKLSDWLGSAQLSEPYCEEIVEIQLRVWASYRWGKVRHQDVRHNIPSSTSSRCCSGHDDYVLCKWWTRKWGGCAEEWIRRRTTTRKEDPFVGWFRKSVIMISPNKGNPKGIDDVKYCCCCSGLVVKLLNEGYENTSTLTEKRKKRKKNVHDI